MDFSSKIESFFDMVLSYIDKINALFDDEQFAGFLIYLYECIPEEVRFIFLLMLLFFILVGFIRIFKE